MPDVPDRPMPPDISVVIPVLNDGPALVRVLRTPGPLPYNWRPPTLDAK